MLRDNNFCVPRAISLEQFVVNSAGQQFVIMSVQETAKDVSLRSNTIRRCWDICDRGTVCKCSDLLTYLLLNFTK